MKQVGLAVQNYTDPNKGLPPNRITNPRTGCLTLLLPYMEETNTFKLYDFKQSWDSAKNAEARKSTISILSCPSVPESGRTAPTDYAPIRRIRGGVMDTWESLKLVQKRTRTTADKKDMASVLTDDRIRRIRQVSDGMSKTLLFIESAGMPQKYVDGKPTTVLTDIYENGIHWYLDQVSFSVSSNVPTEPFINYTNDTEIYSFHTGGVTYARCDGSTHFLSDSVAPESFVSLVTYNSGDLLVEP
jgi:hypothetical protein